VAKLTGRLARVALVLAALLLVVAAWKLGVFHAAEDPRRFADKQNGSEGERHVQRLTQHVGGKPHEWRIERRKGCGSDARLWPGGDPGKQADHRHDDSAQQCLHDFDRDRCGIGVIVYPQDGQEGRVSGRSCKALSGATLMCLRVGESTARCQAFSEREVLTFVVSERFAGPVEQAERQPQQKRHARGSDDRPPAA